MRTVTTDDHVFHSLEEGEEQPVEWANPRFGHRFDWTPYCRWCTNRLVGRWVTCGDRDAKRPDQSDEGYV